MKLVLIAIIVILICMGTFPEMEGVFPLIVDCIQTKDLPSIKLKKVEKPRFKRGPW